MNPNGNPQNLKPVRPGEVRNPLGHNQYTYRDRAKVALEKWCRENGDEFIDYVANAARSGEQWAAKLVWDEVLPKETRHELEARISGSVEVTGTDEWAALAGGLDRLKPEAPELPEGNGNGQSNGSSGDPS